MFYNMSITEQVQTILKNNEYLFSCSNDYNPSNNIQDVVDGNIFQSILESEDGIFIKKGRAFTFLMNTDGISISDKSNLTIWPIYFVIEQIPKNKRFCINNIIIAGISVGESKPNFDIFLEPIINELKELELGINIENKFIRFFVLTGVYDKPARADLLNIINSNGFNSCLKCLQVGTSIGNRRVYEFDKKNPTGPERSKLLYAEHVSEAEKYKTIVHGIKGRCILSHLKYYHPIKNSCIDYMHSVLLGVIKTFFKYWFEGDGSQPYSLKKYMQVIDNRLLRIKPPSYVSNAPRSIYSWNKWRAHEFLTFIIYYLLPVFHKIVPHNIYVNLTKLEVFIETILSTKIYKENLIYIQKIIEDFLKELNFLYDKSIMLSGVHELVHLVECSFEFGPLNNVNCFQFEELNRKFLSFINGKDLIGEEFIKIFSIVQSINCTKQINSLDDLEKFVATNYAIKSSNEKKTNHNKDDIYLSDSIMIIKNKENEEIFFEYENLYNDKVNQLKVYKRIKINGHFYNSKLIENKHDDSCFMKNNLIGNLYWILEKNSQIYFIAEKIVKCYNSFYCPAFPLLKSNMCLCHLTGEYFITTIDSISKICFINLSKTETFTSTFNSSHLFI